MTPLLESLLNNLLLVLDKTLMMSRKNCHGQGLHSIVLHKDEEGRLTRMFMTDSSHKMHLNLPNNHDYSLGVHDHKYDLKLTQLYGRVLNMSYAEGAGEDSTVVNKYQFTSAMSDTEVHTKPYAQLVDSQVKLDIKSVEWLSEEPLLIPHQALHTVYVPEGKVTAWLVEEGLEVKDCTSLYTNSNINLDGCYEEFESAKQVREFIINLLGESRL